MGDSRKRLYFGNAPAYVLKMEDIRKYLSSYGQVIDVKLGFDFFFVEFSDTKDAQDVIHIFQSSPFMGAEGMTVEFARPLQMSISLSPDRSGDSGRRPSPRYPVTLTGLPRGVYWQDLKDFGRSEESLRPVYCDLDKNDRSKAFIEYSSLVEAQDAVQLLDGKCLGGTPVRLSFKLPGDLSDNTCLPSTTRKRCSRSRSPPPRNRKPVRRTRRKLHEEDHDYWPPLKSHDNSCRSRDSPRRDYDRYVPELAAYSSAH